MMIATIPKVRWPDECDFVFVGAIRVGVAGRGLGFQPQLGQEASAWPRPVPHFGQGNNSDLLDDITRPDNDGVHRAAANDFDVKTRATRGSVCNGWLSAIIARFCVNVFFPT